MANRTHNLQFAIIEAPPIIHAEIGRDSGRGGGAQHQFLAFINRPVIGCFDEATKIFGDAETWAEEARLPRRGPIRMLEIRQPDHRHASHIQQDSAIAHLLFRSVQCRRAGAQLPDRWRQGIVLAGVADRIDNPREVKYRTICPPRTGGGNAAILQQMAPQPFQNAIAHLIGKLCAFGKHHLAIGLDQLHIAARGRHACVAIIGQFIGAQDAPALKGFHPTTGHHQRGILVILHFIGGKGDRRRRRWCSGCGRRCSRGRG